MTEPVYVYSFPSICPSISLIFSYDSQHRAVHNELVCELLELFPPSSGPRLLENSNS
jgi:hypothetical protein